MWKLWRAAVRWAAGIDIRWLQLIVFIGFAVRIVLCCCSDGSNDIRIWARFAKEIGTGGLLHEYATQPRFNHPPLMGLWAVFAMTTASTIGVPFNWVFKLLPMAADVVAVPVLIAIVRNRGGSERAGWQVAALFATSLVAILLSGYHGNTDSACALLTLLAVHAVDRRDRPFLAGLLFAAALNVKLIPLVLGPTLFLMQATSLRRASFWCLGLGIGLLPFAAPIIEVGEAFYRNAIAYNSFPNRWGIHFFLDSGVKLPIVGPLLKELDVFWAGAARWVIMASGFLLGIWGRFRRFSCAEGGAMMSAIFIVLAPGIGVQYFVFPALLILAVDSQRGWIYGLLAGLFLTGVYIHFSPLTFPLSSIHRGPFPVWAGVLGIPVWIGLVEFTASRLRRTYDDVSRTA